MWHTLLDNPSETPQRGIGVVMEAMFIAKMVTNTPMLLPHAHPYIYGLVGPPLALINGIDGAHGHAHCHPFVAAR